MALWQSGACNNEAGRFVLLEKLKTLWKEDKTVSRNVSMQKGENDHMPYANPAEVEKCLKGMNYPAKKEDLIKHAQQQGANQDVIEVLKEMHDQDFNSPIDVSKAVGEIDRQQP